MKIKHFAVLLLIVAAATGCKEDSGHGENPVY